MKTMSLVLAAVMATLALAQTPASAQTVKRFDPFVRYIDPYTGEPMAVYRRNYYVPSNDFQGGNFPGNYALRRNLGHCVVDLGYGRFENCN